MVHDAPVVVIPADLREGTRERVVSQNGVTSGWTWPIERVGLACGMGWYRDAGEEIVCFRVGLTKYGRCVKSVN